MFSVLRELTGESPQQVKEWMREIRNDSEFHIEPEFPVNSKFQMPSHVVDMLPAHRQYLRKRGFDPDRLVRLWGLKGIGPAPTLSWRIFIPIRYRNKTISWSTRSISDRHPARYINAPKDHEAMPAKNVLYGMDYARNAVIVNEGFADVWAVGPGAVATMGLNVTPSQILCISRFSLRAICFDNEPEAQKRAQKLCRDLSVFPGETINIVLDSKDAGEASPKEIKKLRKAVFGDA